MKIICKTGDRINILITGDSLAVPAPGIHYGYFLEKELSQIYPEVDVVNSAKFAQTIVGLYEQLVNDLSNFQPDLIILQIGIVDCWPRVELKGNPKTDISTFSRYYNKIIELLKHRTETKVIIIGICPTSRKMETRYPGTLQQIGKYNSILISGSDQQQIFYVDMEKHIDIDQPNVYLMPDDHHLNPKGNKLVFDLIKDIVVV